MVMLGSAKLVQCNVVICRVVVTFLRRPGACSSNGEGIITDIGDAAVTELIHEGWRQRIAPLGKNDSFLIGLNMTQMCKEAGGGDRFVSGQPLSWRVIDLALVDGLDAVGVDGVLGLSPVVAVGSRDGASNAYRSLGGKGGDLGG